MYRSVFLFLLLTACASSTPSRYEQAAPAARPAGWTQTYTSPPGSSPLGPSYTPGGAGASHGGLAAPERQRVPRAEGRALPRTPEPGFWSGTHAKETPGGGGSSGDDDRGRLFGFELPVYVAPGQTIDEAADLTYQCAAMMKRAVDDLSMDMDFQATVITDLYQSEKPLPPKNTREWDEFWKDSDRRFHCLAAALYNVCAGHAATKPIRALKDVEPADLRRLPESSLGALLAQLMRLVEDKCPRRYVGAPGWSAIPKIVSAIERQYPMRTE